MKSVSENEVYIIDHMNKITKLSKMLGEKEQLYINALLNRRDFNTLRAYIESAVHSVQNQLLNRLVDSGYDESLGDRYSIMKKIDNSITYICQELV